MLTNYYTQLNIRGLWENPHESLGIQESQNRTFLFQIPQNRRNFAP